MMEGFDFLTNMNVVFVESLLAVVALLFILTIILFVSRLKIYQVKNVKLHKRLEAQEQKNRLLLEDSENMQIHNTRLTKEHQESAKVVKKHKSTIKKLNTKLDISDSTLESHKKDIKILKEQKDKLYQKIVDHDSVTDELKVALDNLGKRNEFWVAQMSELRIKYNALNKKLSNQNMVNVLDNKAES